MQSRKIRGEEMGRDKMRVQQAGFLGEDKGRPPASCSVFGGGESK